MAATEPDDAAAAGTTALPAARFALKSQDGYTLRVMINGTVGDFTADPSSSKPGQTSIEATVGGQVSLTNTTPQRSLPLHDPIEFPLLQVVRAYPSTSPVCKEHLAGFDETLYWAHDATMCYIKLGVVTSAPFQRPELLQFGVGETKTLLAQDARAGTGVDSTNVPSYTIHEVGSAALVTALNDPVFTGYAVVANGPYQPTYQSWSPVGKNFVAVDADEGWVLAPPK